MAAPAYGRSAAALDLWIEFLAGGFGEAAKHTGIVTVSRQAQNMGKPTIVVEAGHAPPVEHPIWTGMPTVVAGDRHGLFHPLVTSEADVRSEVAVPDYAGLPGSTALTWIGCRTSNR